MIRNKKGFSLVELLAIIFISSLIVWPLTVTLVNNIQINDRLHYRRSATSIADGTMYGLDKLDFTDLETQVDTANTAGDYYIELNQDNCVNLASAADEALCDQIFAAIFNNLTLDATLFRVIIYDYNLPQASIDSLVADTSIPQEVRDEINLLTASTDPNPSLLRVTVWVKYFDDPIGVIALSGLLFESGLVNND